ncbi:hypothetical protein AAG570_006088 [Ranatra chinensis]|uniref:Secreted protein n=1 Tax=Ranatra chinensis TaxID=642074 RepID=A0ABD0YC22_9HEMI
MVDTDSLAKVLRVFWLIVTISGTSTLHACVVEKNHRDSATGNSFLIQSFNAEEFHSRLQTRGPKGGRCKTQNIGTANIMWHSRIVLQKSVHSSAANSQLQRPELKDGQCRGTGRNVGPQEEEVGTLLLGGDHFFYVGVLGLRDGRGKVGRVLGDWGKKDVKLHLFSSPPTSHSGRKCFGAWTPPSALSDCG